MKDKHKKEKKQTLSEAFEELEGITAEFENGEVSLEQGVPKFKRGLELARKLKFRLSEIENEINEIKVEFKDLAEPVTAQETDFSSESESQTEEVGRESKVPF